MKKRNSIVSEVMEVSAETIATLVNNNQENILDSIRNKWISFVKESTMAYKSWIESWHAFMSYESAKILAKC
jgi:hypothetical protein